VSHTSPELLKIRRKIGVGSTSKEETDEHDRGDAIGRAGTRNPVGKLYREHLPLQDQTR